MPLARIITESPDESLELSMQLRARGFRVETVSPDQIPETPADLEVRLEECAPEEVLSKAALVTESEDLWVFVAPGALDERGRPVLTIPRTQTEIEWSDPEPAKSEATMKAPTPPAKNDAAILAELGFSWPKNIAPPRSLPTANPGPATPSDGREPPVAEVPEAASGNGHGTANASPAKVKMVVLPKRPEMLQIPDVPERVQPFLTTVPEVPVRASRRFAGPYKIAFRTGSAFWKKLAVSAVLAVMVGLLAMVIGVRPSLPTASKPSTAPAPVQKPATMQHGSAGVVTSKPAEHRPSSAGDRVAKTPAVTPQPHSGATVQPHPAAATHPQPAAPSHPPGWVSDREIIAEDTVVFYDRKPAAHSGKTAGAKPRSDRQ
jgi:hypothetical protein